MTNIGKIFKRSDNNKTSYHEIKVVDKLLEYQAGVKSEDLASCPKYYLCQRIHPVDTKNKPFLVAEENFDYAYSTTKEQGELL